MANVGDKYIIEIGEVFHGNVVPDVPIYEDNELYRIKGFNSLVFDENGLNKLENYNEKRDGIQRMNDAEREYHYQKGLNDAWEAARKIEDADRKLDQEFRNYLVGSKSGLVEELLSPDEAISKIKAYEEQKKVEKEIKVGDEFIYDNRKGIAVREIYYVGPDKAPFISLWFGTSMVSCNLKNVTKTGRHFDIDGILKAMREG